MSRTDWLDDVSQVVMAADDKAAALAELKQQLPAVAHSSITALSHIIDDKTPNNTIPDEKMLRQSGSLWTGLFRLAKQGDNPTADYLQQYRVLSAARVSLGSAFQTNFLTYMYFFWLVMIMLISLSIITIKTLPVFAGFYQDVGATLPPLTQFVLDGSFLLFAMVSLVLALVIALLIPWQYRSYIKRLLPIPFYLRLFPFYIGTTRNYHRYLQMVFAKVYHRVGEQTPLQRAENQLPKAVLTAHEKCFLHVAQTHGGLSERLHQQQHRFAEATLKHIRIADSLIGSVILMVYGVLVYLYARGIYEPIFQMGDIVG